MNPVASLPAMLGVELRDAALLEQALSHASGSASALDSNERLEFFGDAVLDMIVSEALFHRCPQFREGELTDAKAYVVCRSTLANIARRMGLREWIRLGRGIVGTRELPDSVYANVLEAVLAAVYLDGGYDAAKGVVLRHFALELEDAGNRGAPGNAKSRLQEWLQARRNMVPEYRVLKETGPEHNKTFHVAVTLDGRELGRGRGSNKKEAEQAAARAAMDALEDTDESAGQA